VTAERVPTFPSSVVKTIKDRSAQRARLDNLLTAIRLDQSLSAPLFSGSDRMSKLAEMAARAKALPGKLEALADKLMADMDDVETRAPVAFDGMAREVGKMKEGVKAVEDTVAQLSNGGPPLSDSQSSSEDGKTG
jgi:hypothetical protein